jgi:ornithine carbamoyltransferase
LGGKTLAMIFEKPSTRTRVSFEVGMRELGGQTIMLGRTDTQLGRGETIADTARVLSRYVDIIMMRTTVEEKLLEMAKYATVPVINGLTDKTHPCQLMADVMTFEEHRGDIQGKAIAWSGDGNNMATSWIHAAVQFDFELRVACPPELKPPADVLAWAEKSKGQITIGHDPEAIVRAPTASSPTPGCRWATRIPTARAPRRHNLLRGYQVDKHLMAQAKKDAIFMHCLPAHRGEEVTVDVIDGPQSVVFDEAENRLHAQKSILAWCLPDGLVGRPPLFRRRPGAPCPSSSMRWACAAGWSGSDPHWTRSSSATAIPWPWRGRSPRRWLLCARLATSLKYDGIFTCRSRATGRSGCLVTDLTTDGALRGYAQFDSWKLAVALARQQATRRTAMCRNCSARAPRLHRRPGPAHPALPGRGAARGRDLGRLRPHLFPPVRAAADRHQDRARRTSEDGTHTGALGADGAADAGVRRRPHRRRPRAARGRLAQGRDPDGLGDRGRDARSEAAGDDPAASPVPRRAGPPVRPPAFVARCRCSRERIDRVLRSIKREELDDLRDKTAASR